jgi:SAM-dependent methyltransferase
MKTQQDLHLENLSRQASEHPLIVDASFPTLEARVLHLIHLKAYEEAARLVGGKDVLDFGCNVGYGMSVLASQASSVAGLDVSPKAVHSAQQRLGAGFDIRCYDGVRSTFPDACCDAVTSFQVIEHISDYPAYLTEICRVLRPEGCALFTTPNARMRLYPGMKPWNKFHVREFLHHELVELLSPWFQEVVVRGLFGDGTICRIERDRCAGLRDHSARLQGVAIPWGARIDGMLSGFGRRPAPSRSSKDAAETATFSTADLHYSTRNVNGALEFMVVCQGPKKAAREG